MKQWQIQWSGDLFATTMVLADSPEVAERQFRAMLAEHAGLSINDLPSTDWSTSWGDSGEIDIDGIEETRDE